MAYYASVIVKQAEAWLGRNEADGSHKTIIDVYNSHKPLARGYAVKYHDAWCSTFASAVAIKVGYTAIIPTECGCEKHIQLFKNMGIWQEADNFVPSAGDYIFYDWDDNGVGDNKGSSDHVGIVQKVVAGYIYVIEGNYNNKVAIRKIKLNARYIRGFGCPNYDPEPVVVNKKTVEAVAKEVIQGLWGNGKARFDALDAAGYDSDEVQAMVNKLVKAPSRKAIDLVASEVMRGLWGNGKERRQKLEAAGYDYDEVQSRVNELYY